MNTERRLAVRRFKSTAADQQCMEVQVRVPATVVAGLDPCGHGRWRTAASSVTLEITVVSDFQILRVPVELATANNI